MKPADSIEAGMNLFVRDEGYTSVVTISSADRSLIGTYMATVGIALHTGDPSGLLPFEKVVIAGANGDRYEPETDLETLFELSDVQEEPEFVEIYEG